MSNKFRLIQKICQDVPVTPEETRRDPAENTADEFGTGYAQGQSDLAQQILDLVFQIQKEQK